MSVILNRWLEPDPWLELGVGEVANADWKFGGHPVPVGIDGTHYCGTEEDFAEGGTYDPDLPEVEYSSSGFPLCCQPALGVRGGAGASASSVVTVAKNWSRGGAGASGRSMWGSLVPGPTCPVAADGAIDTTYSASHPGTFGVQQWWRFPISVGTNHWTVTGLTGGILFADLNRGPDCTHLTHVTTQTTDGHRTFSNASGEPFLWITIGAVFGGSPQAYTLNVGPGA